MQICVGTRSQLLIWDIFQRRSFVPPGAAPLHFCELTRNLQRLAEDERLRRCRMFVQRCGLVLEARVSFSFLGANVSMGNWRTKGNLYDI